MSDRPRIADDLNALRPAVVEARRVLRDRKGATADEVRAALAALVGPAEHAAAWLADLLTGEVDA